MKLEELRGEIDRIDKELVLLLEKRFEMTEQVADYKIRHHRAVQDQERERCKLKQVAQMAGPALDAEALEQLFRLILALSRKQQYQKVLKSGGGSNLPFEKVRTLRKEGAGILLTDRTAGVSDAVLNKLLGEGFRRLRAETVHEAMRRLQEKEADFAVVSGGQSFFCERGAQDLPEGVSLVGEVFLKKEENTSARCCDNGMWIFASRRIYTKEADHIRLLLDAPKEAVSLYPLYAQLMENDLVLTRVVACGKEGHFLVEFRGNLESPSVINALQGVLAKTGRMRILGNYEIFRTE